jgi:DNA-binding LacI/PurR family transcriptional regulator
MIIEAKSMNAPCATAALREYLEAGNRPRAVVAFNDSLALGAMHAIRAAGMRIPEDISVVGYDDIPGAALTDPPLTTVRIHTTQMGQEAARRLISQLQARGHDGAPPVPTRTILRNELVIRQSCGCPAAG